MQDGRFSTIKFNEWICVTAQYEKAVARLGRQVYQGYSRGILTDFTSIEICKEISETFGEAREIRADLEEELERDALDGLSVEETKKADEHRELTQAQLTKRKIKLKFTKFMGRQAINRSLASHRDRVKQLSRELGLRALAVYKEEAVLKVRGHKALCRLAESLNDDSDVKWQEIVTVNKETGSSLSFHTILISFIGNFANFSKGTAIGKFLLKYFKYDEDEENKKLSQQYEGSSTAEALKAQMEEIDEPHLDVGREMDNMQQEYEETPAEWGMPSSNQSSGEDLSSYFQEDPDPEPEPLEKWEPQSDTWDPDAAVDEDFLDVVADVPEFSPPPEPETFEPEPPPSPAGPTLLRRRSEPEAESWLESSSSPEPPAAPSLPRVGQTPAPASEPTPAGDDWNWQDDNNEDPWAETISPQEAAALDPMGTQSIQFGQSAPAAFQQQTPPPAPPQQSPPASGQRPPFMNTQAPPAAPEKPLGDWSQSAPAAPEKPLGDWSQSAPAAPGKPLGNWSQSAPAAPEKPLGDWSQPAASPAPEKPLGDWSQPAPTPPQKPLGDWSQQATPTPQEKPLGDWSQPASAGSEAPLGDWSQSAGSGPSDWGNSSTGSQDFGWGTEAQQSPSPQTPQPTQAPPSPAPAPSPQQPARPAPSQSQSPQRPAPTPPASPTPSSGDSLGDDLLPAFLKNRTQDESDSSTFIPELPSSLGGEGSAPALELRPFGSKDKPKDEPGEEPFIPQMPDF